MSGQKALDIVFVINKANNFGLAKDAEILEEGIRLQSRNFNIPVNKIRYVDPREPPSVCDVAIHFEEPYAVWFSWARYHCLLVNPEWWTEEWNGYKEKFNQWIFKTDFARKDFLNKGVCTEENSVSIKWRAKQTIGQPTVKKSSGGGGSKKVVETTVEYNNASVGWVWFLGGSVNKRQAAIEVLPLWSAEWPSVTVYTTSPLAIDKPLAPNVSIKVQDLPQEERERLAAYYPGHICMSKAEGFGYTAAEAAQVGAFTMLNPIDTYKEYYEDCNGIAWASFDFESLKEANEAYLSANLEEVRLARKQEAIAASAKWDKSMNEWFSKFAEVVKASPKLPKHMPPLLGSSDCPAISVISLVYGRPKFIELAFHNLMLTDYPREKIEWVVVDDSPPEVSSSDKIVSFEEKFYPGKIRYIPLPKKVSIGRKRNIGCRRAANNIILMMDDDDHYPQTSFRRRVAWLLKDKTPHKAAVCTTIALYDLKKAVSAVNVPPYRLGLAKRASEATLTFTSDFWLERNFPEVDVAEGEGFLAGREADVIEMPPQQIIVSFTHGENSTSRRIPGEEANKGCFWGFPKPYLEFVHKLAGMEIEETAN